MKNSKSRNLVGDRLRQAKDREGLYRAEIAEIVAKLDELLDKHGTAEQALGEFDAWVQRKTKLRLAHAYGTLKHREAERLAAQAAKPGEGHSMYVADSDHDHVAPARQPNASGGGQDGCARDGHEKIAASARAETAGKGHRNFAGDGHTCNADPRHPNASESDQTCPASEGQSSTVAPARDPIADGAAKRGMSARTAFDLPPVCDPSAPAENGGGGHGSHVQQDQCRLVPAAASDGTSPSRAGEDHAVHADQGQSWLVPPARDPDSPKPDGDHITVVANGDQGTHVSTRPPIASGTASPCLPEKARANVPPAREPSDEERLAMERASDLAFYRTAKLRNKAWTVYRFDDLPKVRSENLKENALVNEVIDYGRKNRIHGSRLVHLNVPAREMRAMMKRIDGALLAHAELAVGKNKKSERSRRHG